MSKEIKQFDISFNGKEYSVDIIIQDNDTSLFIEYTNSNDDVEKEELVCLTNYLINEGFITYHEE